MKSLLHVAAFFLGLLPSHALIISIDHLATPAAYDNAQTTYGQTFTAVANTVLGVQVYLGDPARLSNTAVNELAGPVDLVLFDVANMSAPFELARTTVLTLGQSASGLTTFLFTAPVQVTSGSKYFFEISTSDPYGLGLRATGSSTYSGGAEARLTGSGIIEAITGRDLSFSVLSVPEFANTGGLLSAAFTSLLLLSWVSRRASQT